ncbi:MAG: hypothetical protein DVB25_07600 [Verrucomicrobia bacterium]|nr:MAG: hypothetical protein DVB25_07600 [Verrucomicrobiota bacterium]
MKAKLRNSTVLVSLALIGSASADIIYSNLQNTAISTGWTGVTVNVNGGFINPFFGGVGVANDVLFQPARVGTDQLATILNLAVGTSISSSNGTLYFSTGAGGSQDHLGSSFTAGTEGYIGFNANGDYGWMRVIFTNNTGGAMIEDWAYDNSGSGGSIVVGRVQESVVDATHNLVTLSPASSEAFTLGSVLADKGSGVTNSVIKTGAGTTTLSGTNTYAGLTTVSVGTLKAGSASAFGTTAEGTSVTSGAVLDLNGQSIGAEAVTLNGTGLSSGGALVNSSGTAASLSGAVTLGSASSIGGSGNMTLSGGISGAHNLTKVGGDTVTLSGSNTYTGITTISGGTLALGPIGTIANTPLIKVQSGANLNVSAVTGGWAVQGSSSSSRQTLSGSGAVIGATTIGTNGTQNAGDARVGTQTFSSSLTYASGSIFEWDLDRTQTQTRGTGYDAVNVGGTLGGTAAIFRIVTGDTAYTQDFWSQTHTWSNIFDFASITTNLASIFNGGFDYATSPAGQGAFTWQTNTLQWTPQSGATFVPEPSSALAGLLLAAGLLRRRRTGAS